MNKDYITQIDGAERRYAVHKVSMETRELEGKETNVVRGYAALFDVETVIGNSFREVVRKGFFDKVMDQDVRCLFNHIPSYILARCINGKGTLSLSVDDEGLAYEYETPNRSWALDVADAIEKGDVSQSSFSFYAEKDVWVQEEGKLPLRELILCKTLYDVSPVTYPAYPDTVVAKRSLDAFTKENPEQRSDENKGLSMFEAQIIINKNF